MTAPRLAIQQLLNFCQLLFRHQQVERRVVLPSGEWENDTEHSYNLAMVAWYVSDQLKLQLDVEKMLKYALIHDLPEVYAGDTFAFGDRRDKKEREAKALARIKSEMPEASAITGLVEKYEERADQESRFVWALDKLMPPLISYLGQGLSWRRNSLTFEMVENHHGAQFATYPEILELWNQLKILIERDPSLFDPILPHAAN